MLTTQTMVSVLALLLMAACGGNDCPPLDDGATDAEDLDEDTTGDVVTDTVEDSIPDGDEPTPECLADADCDDGVFCTNDVCSTGECVNVVSHDRCDPGDLCHPDDDCQRADTWLCLACVEDAGDCARYGDRCAEVDGESLCLLPCETASDCPDDFTCEEVEAASGAPLGTGCVPPSSGCCIDWDDDGAGVGPDCSLTDCDESDDDVFEGADELCNGVDDDCDGELDDDVVDCPTPSCSDEGSGDTMIPYTCVDSSCELTDPVACAPYLCDGAGEWCTTSCVDDTTCSATAHCDLERELCLEDFADGNWCFTGDECASGNCQTGVCCAAGESCCAMPGSYESESCGGCSEGLRDRVCTDGFFWEDWSSCWGTICMPGTTSNCGNCGTKTCTSSCEWGYSCVYTAGAEDAWEFNDYPSWAFQLPDTWDSGGAPVTITPTMHRDHDVDMFWLYAYETAWAWDVLTPYVRITVPAGEHYSLAVIWRLHADSIEHTEPRVHAECPWYETCTAQVDIPIIDWTLSSENMTIFIEVKAESEGSCETYTLHIDA